MVCPCAHIGTTANVVIAHNAASGLLVLPIERRLLAFIVATMFVLISRLTHEINSPFAVTG